MLTLRRILFILFSLIYLVCCPLIVLYALGINLTPRGGQNLTKTGLISLATVPAAATIYLDNLRFVEKTPCVIRNLVPGEYSIKLVLKGFRVWEKIVSVKAETATVLENIILIPYKFQTEPLSSLSLEELVPVHNNSFFVLTRGPLVKDIFLWRINEKLSEQILPALDGAEKRTSLAPLFPKDTIYNDAKLTSYVTVEGSPSLLLNVNLKGDDKSLWIDLRQRLPLIDDITDLVIKKPEDITWEPQDNKNIFLYRDDSLTRLETDTKAIYPNIAQGFLGWGIHDQRLYTLSSQRLLKKSSYDGKEEELVFQGPSSNLSYIGGETIYRIHVLDDNLLIFHGHKGELLTNRTPLPLVDKGVKDFDFDKVSGRLLFFTEHKLGVIDLSFSEGGIELGPRLIWLVTDAKNIEQAFWVNKASYIVYRDQDRIVLAETEKFNSSASHELIHVKRNSQVVYSEAAGKLYYLDAKTHQLMELNVIPMAEKFSFNMNPKDKESRKP